ncbi:MAG: penicillin-binding protein [Gordonibacter sp.]
MEDWTSDLPSLENTDAFNFAEDSHMLDSSGNTILAEFQLENRTPVDQNQVSEYVLKGTVATEDVRFHEHNGVDPTGIARALMNNLTGGALEGASTITQQLVRNTVLSQEANDISFERKIREAQLAINLEKKYSKDQILMLYLNTINYGDQCYGIEAAAQNYFQTTSLDLTLVQAATLIGIPQSPTANNPKLNPDTCLKRRNVVLDRMLSAGVITQEEHDVAQNEPLALNPAPPAPEEGIYAYPYFTSFVRDKLLNEGDKFNLSDGDLFEGGLTVYTSLNTDLQDKAEAACVAQNERMDENLESALVAIDPQNGYIQAMVGGKDYFQNKWNIAAQGGQPTGSTFKAFTLAAAIEQGIDPKTPIDCSNPMKVDDGHELWNFGNYNFGTLSIQNATAKSSNTGYYRLAQQVTPAAMNDMAARLGADIVDPNNIPMETLGTENVTPLSMAGAYGTFATGGIKHDAIAITKIVDKGGNVIYEAPDTSTRVISEEVSGAVTKVLKTVFNSEGTAAGMGPLNGQPVAGKTGTVMEFRGHWLVGYAPTISCAVWIGDRNYQPTEESLTANALWQDFMSRALEGQPIVQFPETQDPEYKNPFNTEQQKKLGNEEKDPSKAPSVVGKTIPQAQALLGGYVVYTIEEYSDTVAAGLIISQSVEGNRLLLHVSKGAKPADPAPTPPPSPTPDPPTPDPPKPPNPDPPPNPAQGAT